MHDRRPKARSSRPSSSEIPSVIVIGEGDSQLRISFQKQRATLERPLQIYMCKRTALLEHERDVGDRYLPSLFWLSHVWKTNLTGWSVYRIVAISLVS
jgi:hypothetical protein